MCNYHAPPLGGYRVYVREGLDLPHAYDRWVEELKAGNCFVTNYPLIPRFEVEGLEPGDELVLPSVPTPVDVSLRVESVFGLDTAQIIFSGSPVLTIPNPCQNGAGVLDTTVTVTIEGSGWLALSVEGSTSAWGPVQSDLFAHTGAIYVDAAGETVVSTVDAAHFMGWIDSLQMFVELRGNWSGTQRAEVLGTLNDARDVYSTAFQVPPNPFELISPGEGEVVYLNETVEFDWELNGDSEPGDRLAYLFQISEVPGFYPMVLSQWSDSVPESIAADLLEPDAEYWWRVRAYDLGGNYTDCTPEAIRFTTLDWQSSIPTDDELDSDAHDGGPALQVRPHAILQPSPVTDRLQLQLVPPDADLKQLRIYDSGGRLIGEYRGSRAPTGAGLRRVGSGQFVGQLQDQSGAPLPTGRYWIQLAGSYPDEQGGRQPWRHSAPILIVR